jgi:hypothetical protein
MIVPSAAGTVTKCSTFAERPANAASTFVLDVFVEAMPSAVEVAAPPTRNSTLTICRKRSQWYVDTGATSHTTQILAT